VTALPEHLPVGRAAGKGGDAFEHPEFVAGLLGDEYADTAGN
jgi:hypothetical protein